MSDNILAIAATAAKAVIDVELPIQDQARQAMKEMSDFWLTTDEDLRFRGAVGGLLLANKDNEEVTEVIKYELNVIRSLSAASNGVSVDFGSVFSGADDMKVIGLAKLWREAND